MKVVDEKGNPLLPAKEAQRQRAVENCRHAYELAQEGYSISLISKRLSLTKDAVAARIRLYVHYSFHPYENPWD